MNHLLYNKEIKYILTNQGNIIVNDVNSIIKLIKKGVPLTKIFVENINKDIKEYNKHLPFNKKITTLTDVNSIIYPKWLIPSKYLEIDIFEYIQSKFIQHIGCDSSLNDANIELRANRLVKEYELFEQKQLLDILRLVIYIIDKFEENDIIWGIGRGSSVSSYILYVIGLHDVDPIKYELNITDFLK